MFQKLSKIGIIFVSLFFVACTSTPDVDPVCEQQWQSWKDSYAAHSPIASLQKTSEWKVNPREVEEVIAGDTSIAWQKNIKLAGINLANMDLKNLVGEFTDEKRDATIRQNLRKLIRTNPKNNLLIINTGLIHAFDYYYETLDQSVLYATLPFHKKSLFYTRDFYLFKEAINDPEHLKRGHDLSALPLLAAYYKLYHHLKFRKITKQDLFQPKEQNSNVIIVGEIHILREKSLARRLPSASCLKQQGYDSITYVQEHSDLKYGHVYSHTQVKDAVDMMQRLRRNFPHPFLSRLSEVQVAPASLALIERMKRYQTTGIKVTFKGLE